MCESKKKTNTHNYREHIAVCSFKTTRQSHLLICPGNTTRKSQEGLSWNTRPKHEGEKSWGGKRILWFPGWCDQLCCTVAFM